MVSVFCGIWCADAEKKQTSNSGREFPASVGIEFGLEVAHLSGKLGGVAQRGFL